MSNFADDTQTIIVSENQENLLETTSIEVNSVLNFFRSNNLVNNPEKSALLYNSKGKGENITVKNIGGQNIQSTHSEKLLGLNINSNFDWTNHIDQISIALKKELGYLEE